MATVADIEALPAKLTIPMRHFLFLNQEGEWAGPVSTEDLQAYIVAGSVTAASIVIDASSTLPVVLPKDPDFMPSLHEAHEGSAALRSATWSRIPEAPLMISHSKMIALDKCKRSGINGEHLRYLGLWRVANQRRIIYTIALLQIFYSFAAWKFSYRRLNSLETAGLAAGIFIGVVALAFLKRISMREYQQIERGEFPDAHGLPLQ